MITYYFFYCSFVNYILLQSGEKYENLLHLAVRSQEIRGGKRNEFGFNKNILAIPVERKG